MKGESIVEFLKLAATAGATGAAGEPFLRVFNEYVQQPVWGVPVTVFGAAMFGAALSLCFGDPVPSRKSLFTQIFASAAFGAGLAVLLADAANLEWAQKNMAMFAMITAAILRWFLPSAIDKVKQLIKDFKLSLITKRGQGEDK